MFALIFVKTVPGKELTLLKQIPQKIGNSIAKVNGEPFCYEFAGPYDIIVGVLTDSMESIRMILAEIRNLDGVLDTVTSIAVK